MISRRVSQLSEFVLQQRGEESKQGGGKKGRERRREEKAKLIGDQTTQGEVRQITDGFKFFDFLFH